MKGRIVVVSADDESCFTSFIRFGSVRVAGYRIAGCATRAYDVTRISDAMLTECMYCFVIRVLRARDDVKER